MTTTGQLAPYWFAMPCRYDPLDPSQSEVKCRLADSRRSTTCATWVASANAASPFSTSRPQRSTMTKTSFCDGATHSPQRGLYTPPPRREASKLSDSVHDRDGLESANVETDNLAYSTAVAPLPGEYRYGSGHSMAKPNPGMGIRTGLHYQRTARAVAESDISDTRAIHDVSTSSTTSPTPQPSTTSPTPIAPGIPGTSPTPTQPAPVHQAPAADEAAAEDIAPDPRASPGSRR